MSIIADMREFIRDYKLMAIRPRAGKTPVLKGRFEFSAKHPEAGEVEDAFDLEIDVPATFPRDLPTVIETGNRIPRTQTYHVNQTDWTLCLGSPLRLLVLLSEKPSLTGFAEKCLVPYLFAISQKLSSGVPLPFGQLDHGAPGALADYQILFGLKSAEQALATLRVLGQKKRRTNKQPCPMRLPPAPRKMSISQSSLSVPRSGQPPVVPCAVPRNDADG